VHYIQRQLYFVHGGQRHSQGMGFALRLSIRAIRGQRDLPAEQVVGARSRDLPPCACVCIVHTASQCLCPASSST
jgi:hypothetical protein